MTKLFEVAAVFFKLGLFAFGGPAAHIGMMEDEVVIKRKWMTRQHFLDLVGVTNLIPGPNSTEMAIHCGFHRAGRLGLIVAGISFILPAAVIVIILGYMYRIYGSIPDVEPFLLGIKPVVLIIMLSAVIRLGKKAAKSTEILVIGALIAVLSLIGWNAVHLIFLGGICGAIWLKFRHQGNKMQCFSPIFLVFLKIGSILFGSGYILIVYLKSELIDRNQWINEQTLLDALAVGQMTPGPVLTTATFIGFQLQGLQGALLATLGIFLPSFVFVYFINPWIPKIRANPLTANFLDAVNVSAVGLMLAVACKLAGYLLIDWRNILIAIICAVFVFRYPKLSPLWSIVGGALFGWVLYGITGTI